VKADTVATTWTRLYTRGLPNDVAERRREELVSDLYEHSSVQGRTSAQQREVLGRVLWGIPADLSWRRAAKAPRLRRLQTGASMTLRNVTTGVFSFIILFELWASAGVWLGQGAEDGSDAGGWRYGVPFLIAAAVIAFALRTRDEAPRRSTVLLVIGAAAPALVFYWMAPIFIPFWLVASGLAIASEPGRHTPAAAV
jgi:hypothetical protein